MTCPQCARIAVAFAELADRLEQRPHALAELGHDLALSLSPADLRHAAELLAGFAR